MSKIRYEFVGEINTNGENYKLFYLVGEIPDVIVLETLIDKNDPARRYLRPLTAEEYQIIIRNPKIMGNIARLKLFIMGN